MKIDESNIGRFNFYSTFFLLILFAIAIIFSSISAKKESFEKLKIELQSKFINDKKNQIKANVLIVDKLLTMKIREFSKEKIDNQKVASLVIEELNKENMSEYFFVFELSKNSKNEYIQRVLVHPFISSGEIFDINSKDLNGNFYVKEYLEKILKYDSTFLNYSFAHPKTKVEKYKTAFFKLNRELNWIIASGFYLNDIDGELKRIESNLESDINKELNQELIITVVFLLILIVLVVALNSYTYRVIKKFKEEVKEKQKKLYDSENYLKQYTAIIERSNIVSRTDPDGIITYASDDFCKLIGYEKDELLGKTHALLRHPDSTDKFFEKMWYIIQSKQTFKSVVKNLTKDGRTVYFNTTISPILDDEGKIIEFAAHRFDITNETELQEELKAQNEKLKKAKNILNEAQRIAHVGNWEYNIVDDEMYFSKEARSIYGLNIFDNGMNLEEFKKLFDKDELVEVEKKHINAMLNNEKLFVEHKVLRKDNSVVFVEVHGEYLYNENKEPIKSFGSVHDITLKKEAQKELHQKDLLLLQQSKMAAMGEMISNIAHQWRQPLSTISTAATGAKLQKEIGAFDDKDFGSTMDSINNAVQYLSKTIDDFRYFFKPNNKKSYFEAKNVINRAVGLVEPQFKSKDIIIIKEIENHELYGLENELLQVLINLLNNARDQILKNDGKNIILITSYKDEKNSFISIQDSGNGIPEDIINRIFEPYFTTKHQSKGTGIGLYMSEEIIVKHMKGTITASNCQFEYEDKTYSGAKLEIRLPNEEIQ